VREGAFLLEVSRRYFPAGSVFVAVVDPGVGTERAPLALAAEGRFFVGPDNGLLTGALPTAALAGGQSVRLENPSFRLPDMSATFHGRDVFAPAGAALAVGVPLEELGPPLPLDALVPLPQREPVVSERRIEGRLVHVDRFGNLVSDVSRDLWDRTVPTASALQVQVAEWTGTALLRTYADAPPGEPLALFGSLGYLEVAVNGGSAAQRLGVGRGEPVVLQF
jgi:S-adenosylmethionine hydrolase